MLRPVDLIDFLAADFTHYLLGDKMSDTFAVPSNAPLRPEFYSFLRNSDAAAERYQSYWRDGKLVDPTLNKLRRDIQRFVQKKLTDDLRNGITFRTSLGDSGSIGDLPITISDELCRTIQNAHAASFDKAGYLRETIAFKLSAPPSYRLFSNGILLREHDGMAKLVLGPEQYQRDLSLLLNIGYAELNVAPIFLATHQELATRPNQGDQVLHTDGTAQRFNNNKVVKGHRHILRRPAHAALIDATGTPRRDLGDTSAFDLPTACDRRIPVGNDSAAVFPAYKAKIIISDSPILLVGEHTIYAPKGSYLALFENHPPRVLDGTEALFVDIGDKCRRISPDKLPRPRAYARQLRTEQPKLPIWWGLVHYQKQLAKAQPVLAPK